MLVLKNLLYFFLYNNLQDNIENKINLIILKAEETNHNLKIFKNKIK